MVVRQTTTTILSLQLILLLLSRYVASISLSQFQQIQGFSNSCENVWQEDIPGCTKKDFATSNSCSRNCLAGVNIINAEVLVACADARVSSNSLLGEFLAGFGVSALCGSSSTETATIADSTTATTATATALKTSATSTSLTSVKSTTTTTTTAVQETTTQPSVLATTAAATTSTPSSVTTSTTATSVTDLTLSFTGTTTTSPTSFVSSTTTSAKTSSTSSSNTEAKGFGGVGDAFDILGGESAGSRLEYVSWNVMSLMSVLVIVVARGIW